MLRRVFCAVVLFLPACSYPPLPQLPGGGPGNDAGSDGPGMSSDASAMSDATLSTFCDPITGLVACYEFEGNAKDGSGNGLDATPTNVTFVPGQVGQAMQVGNSSNVTVSANSLFDNVSAFTIEAWIQPSPSGTSNILDVNHEYTFSLRSDGRLLCDTSGGGQVISNTAVLTGQWTHVACTYDGTAMNTYINGSVVGTTQRLRGDHYRPKQHGARRGLPVDLATSWPD